MLVFWGVSETLFHNNFQKTLQMLQDLQQTLISKNSGLPPPSI